MTVRNNMHSSVSRHYCSPHLANAQILANAMWNRYFCIRKYNLTSMRGVNPILPFLPLREQQSPLNLHILCTCTFLPRPTTSSLHYTSFSCSYFSLSYLVCTHIMQSYTAYDADFHWPTSQLLSLSLFCHTLYDVPSFHPFIKSFDCYLPFSSDL